MNDFAQQDQTPQEPQQDDRYAALADRIAHLTQTLETVQSRETQREQQSEFSRQQRHIEQIEREAANRVQEATTRLQKAYDDSDASAIAAATAALSTATAEQTAAKMQVESFKRQAQQAQQQAQQRPQQQQPQQQARQQSVDDTNLKKWRERNASWYGIDADMTAKALQVAKQVEGERVLEVGSTAYFNAIDARLRREFPEQMGQATPPSAHVNTQRGSGMGQTPAAQGERIPASIADGFRRMGLDVDNPEVAKQLIDARRVAVSKGFLPEKPYVAPVITR